MAICAMTVIWGGILFAIIQIVAAESPLRATSTESQHHPEITSSSPHHAIDQSPRQNGVLAKRAGSDSICGYVTSDIHFPWYCSPEQYCDTRSKYLRCCNKMSTVHRMDTQVATYTVTDRNTLTLTSLQTQTVQVGSVVYDDCAVQSQCFNSADAAKCSGSCNSTALLCTNQYFPYCASVYYAYGNSTSGMGYMCDTTSWGMKMYNYGYWPSSTVTSTRTVNTTTTIAPTWTPHPVPFSRTQAWRQQQALITGVATTTSGAALTSIRSNCLVWMAVLMTFLFQFIE